MARDKASIFIIFFYMMTFVFSGEEVQAAPREKYKRTVENYVVPDVTLVNQNGAKVKLRSLISSKKVVLIDFIFTTCTTICPVLSAGFRPTLRGALHPHSPPAIRPVVEL